MAELHALLQGERALPLEQQERLVEEHERRIREYEESLELARHPPDPNRRLAGQVHSVGLGAALAFPPR